MGASVLQDLVVVMVVAAAATILFNRLRQPLVLGYLLAGALIGPYTTPFGLIQDLNSIQALAQLGLVFLLFALGLEFNLNKLRRVGLSALFAATIEILITFAAGWRVALFLGWSPVDAAFTGAILSFSSTTVILKILMDLGKVGDEFAEIALGVLIVEDLIAVVAVAVLGGLNAGGGLSLAVATTTLAQLGLYVLITLAVGLVVVPRLIEWVAKHQSDEILVITVVGLVLLNAVVATRLGLSQTLGAFLTGAIIGESRAVKRVEDKIIPIRDLFTAVFFVAAGMLLDVHAVFANWIPIVLLTLVGIFAKILGGTVGVFAAGYNGRTSFHVGQSLGIFDEFTFILASLGVAAGLVAPSFLPLAVGIVLLSTFITPYIIRSSDATTDAIARIIPSRMADWSEGWAEHMARRRAEKDQDPHGPSMSGARPLFYAAWLLGLLIAAAYASDWLSQVPLKASIPPVAAFGMTTPFLLNLNVETDVVRGAAFTLLSILAIPLFASFEISVEHWFLRIRRSTHLGPGMLARPGPSWRTPRMMARVVAVVASLVLLALALRIAWGVDPLFLPDPILLLPLLVAVAATTLLAWPFLLRTYHQFDASLDLLLGRTDDLAPFARLEGRYPWGMVTEAVRIRPQANVAFLSLGSLHLEDTGVSILGIERGGHNLVTLHRDFYLLPNDRVFFIGRSEQTARAVRILTGAPEPVPQGKETVDAATIELAIPVGSPAVGCSLEQLALDRAGIRVLHHARRNHDSGPPDPLLPLRIGDRLVLRGAPRDVERVRSTLRLGPVPQAAA